MHTSTFTNSLFLPLGVTTIISDLVSDHYVLLMFISAFFLGEAVIISFAYLSADLNLPIFPLLIAAFVATILSDSCWFLLGSVLDKKLETFKTFRDKKKIVSIFLDRLIGSRLFFLLLFMKFFYGMRIISIIYLSGQKMLFKLFTMYNSLGTLVWLAVIFSLGYATGIGVETSLPSINGIEVALIIIVVTSILLRLLGSWIPKLIKKE